MKRDLIEQHLPTIALRLRSKGFRRVPKWATFQRATAEGCDGLQFSRVVHGDDTVTIGCSFSVRFDAVEQLVVAHSEDAYCDHPNRATFAVFHQGGKVINSQTDSTEVVAWLEEAMAAAGDPLFARYSHRTCAQSDLENEPAASQKFDFPADHERAKRVVAFAWLYDGRNEAMLVSQRQRNWLQHQPSAIVPDFDHFVESLLSETNVRR